MLIASCEPRLGDRLTAARRTPLEPHDVEVHLLSFACFAGQTRALRGWLSAEERWRAAEFRQSADRDRFILAHVLKRGVLARHLRLDPTLIEFGRSDFGRPFPLSPEREGEPAAVSFSLSHCETHAAIAVSRLPWIGVDVERHRPTLHTVEIVRSCFAAEERRRLARTAQSHEDHRFVRLWTCKEAIVKAIGLGLSYPLDRFTVKDFDTTTPVVASIEPAYGPAPAWSLALRVLGDGCYATVATLGRTSGARAAPRVKVRWESHQ